MLTNNTARGTELSREIPGKNTIAAEPGVYKGSTVFNTNGKQPIPTKMVGVVATNPVQQDALVQIFDKENKLKYMLLYGSNNELLHVYEKNVKTLRGGKEQETWEKIDTQKFLNEIGISAKATHEGIDRYALKHLFELSVKLLLSKANKSTMARASELLEEGAYRITEDRQGKQRIGVSLNPKTINALMEETQNIILDADKNDYNYFIEQYQNIFGDNETSKIAAIDFVKKMRENKKIDASKFNLSAMLSPTPRLFNKIQDIKNNNFASTEDDYTLTVQNLITANSFFDDKSFNAKIGAHIFAYVPGAGLVHIDQTLTGTKSAYEVYGNFLRKPDSDLGKKEGDFYFNSLTFKQLSEYNNMSYRFTSEKFESLSKQEQKELLKNGASLIKEIVEDAKNFDIKKNMPRSPSKKKILTNLLKIENLIKRGAIKATDIKEIFVKKQLLPVLNVKLLEERKEWGKSLVNFKFTEKEGRPILNHSQGIPVSTYYNLKSPTIDNPSIISLMPKVDLKKATADDNSPYVQKTSLEIEHAIDNAGDVFIPKRYKTIPETFAWIYGRLSICDDKGQYDAIIYNKETGEQSTEARSLDIEQVFATFEYVLDKTKGTHREQTLEGIASIIAEAKIAFSKGENAILLLKERLLNLSLPDNIDLITIENIRNASLNAASYSSALQRNITSSIRMNRSSFSQLSENIRALKTKEYGNINYLPISSDNQKDYSTIAKYMFEVMKDALKGSAITHLMVQNILENDPLFKKYISDNANKFQSIEAKSNVALHFHDALKAAKSHAELYSVLLNNEMPKDTNPYFIVNPDINVKQFLKTEIEIVDGSERKVKSPIENEKILEKIISGTDKTSKIVEKMIEEPMETVSEVLSEKAKNSNSEARAREEKSLEALLSPFESGKDVAAIMNSQNVEEGQTEENQTEKDENVTRETEDVAAPDALPDIDIDEIPDDNEIPTMEAAASKNENEAPLPSFDDIDMPMDDDISPFDDIDDDASFLNDDEPIIENSDNNISSHSQENHTANVAIPSSLFEDEEEVVGSHPKL